MRNSFSVDSRTERKRVPDNAPTGTKVTKTGHFGKLRIWGFKKNAPMGITMRGQILCAYSLSITFILELHTTVISVVFFGIGISWYQIQPVSVFFWLVLLHCKPWREHLFKILWELFF
jgi:hypothetical protein